MIAGAHVSVERPGSVRIDGRITEGLGGVEERTRLGIDDRRFGPVVDLHGGGVAVGRGGSGDDRFGRAHDGRGGLERHRDRRRA